MQPMLIIFSHKTILTFAAKHQQVTLWLYQTNYNKCRSHFSPMISNVLAIHNLYIYIAFFQHKIKQSVLWLNYIYNFTSSQKGVFFYGFFIENRTFY